jgi:type II secretory pathway component PulF
MFYPMVVMVIFVGVLLSMLLVVIPRISQVFSRLNVELPLPTKILIFTSNLIIHQWLWVSSITAVLIAVFVILFNTKREVVLRVLFSLPGVSKLVTQIDITRFSRSLNLLLASGIPITTSLELAQEVILKKEVSDLVAIAREQAQAGHPFSAGLRSPKNLIPSMMIKLMEVGERSGTLEEAMLNVSEHMDYTVSKSIKKLTAMLEPIMLVLVGLAVGGMMLSIIAPIYGLISQVGQ